MRESRGVPAMASLHLKGSQAIEEIFGVSRRTVRAWISRGAPIKIVGRKYQACYPELWRWVSEDAVRGASAEPPVKSAEHARDTAMDPEPGSGWYVVVPGMGTLGAGGRQAR